MEETPELLYAYLEGLFSIRTTPDKLIAFVYNKIICTDYRGIITYKTSYIADRFNGMAIGLLARTVKPQLELSLHTQLPDKAVQPLLDKLGKPASGYEDRTFETAPFTLTARQITDCSNWIMKKFEEVIQNVDAAYNA